MVSLPAEAEHRGHNKAQQRRILLEPCRRSLSSSSLSAHGYGVLLLL